MNRRKTAGVFGRDGKWRAQIYFKGVGYSIGTFTDKDEAQRIRNWVARQLRGEFAPEVNDNTDYKPEMFPPRLRALLF